MFQVARLACFGATFEPVCPCNKQCMAGAWQDAPHLRMRHQLVVPPCRQRQRQATLLMKSRGLLDIAPVHQVPERCARHKPRIAKGIHRLHVQPPHNVRARPGLWQPAQFGCPPCARGPCTSSRRLVPDVLQNSEHEQVKLKRRRCKPTTLPRMNAGGLACPLVCNTRTKTCPRASWMPALRP